MTHAFVELDRVKLRYQEDESLALEHTDMKIANGEFIAVVGPSGCGKSSLLKLVSGLLPTTEGTVIVDGHEVSGPLKICGMAFQNPTLLPWRSTISNVLLPLEIVQPHRSKMRTQRKTFEERAMHLLAEVGLDGAAEKFPWELSGGMQQRANLCRALIHEPDLLLLDEPFGALDAFTREELWDTLQTLWMERPFTVLLVTHDLREAVYLADTIYVMSTRPGRILARYENPRPRPRTQEMTFEKDFGDLVHELKGHIRTVRAT